MLKACFGSSYIYTLLKDGFHVPEAARFITYTNIVENRAGEKLDVNWVLGALLVEVLAVDGNSHNVIHAEHHAGGKQLAGSEATPSGAGSATLDGESTRGEGQNTGTDTSEGTESGGQTGSEGSGAGEDEGFVVVEGTGKGGKVAVDNELGVDGFEGLVGEGAGTEEWEPEAASWDRQGVLLLGLLGVAAVGLFIAWRMDAFGAWGTGSGGSEVAYKRSPSKDDEETGVSMTSREGGKAA